MREPEFDPLQDPMFLQAIRQVLAYDEPLPDEARVRVLWTKVASNAGLDLAAAPIAEPGMRPTSVHGRGVRRMRRVPPSSRHPVWYTVAGAVLSALLLITDWAMFHRPMGTTAVASGSVYTTGKGERANITLPDGSTVVLDVGSHLEVPTDFGAGNHVVRLTGEALFTVSHHDGTPFTVMAGRTAARVLGTTFVVRHYPDDTTTRVAVQDGKVVVAATVVTAQRMIEVAHNGAVHIGPADASQFSFATGVLTLNPTPLANAIPELNRWYDADIRLGDPVLGAQEIRGKLTAGSLAELTEILRLTLNVRVERTGRVITLYPSAR